MKRVALPAIAALALACSPDTASDRAADERVFLAAITGEWAGTIAETPALQKHVMRETPMHLVVAPDEAPRVEYPLVECAGVLSPAPPSEPFTKDTGRFLLRIVSGKPGGVCQSGLVRLVLRGDTLEYTFLGDTLRRITASLERNP